MGGLGRCAGAAWSVFRHRYLSSVFRLALGGTFVVSAAGKLPEGGAFVAQVQELDLLPQALAQFYGTALPWVELSVGVLLLLGLLSRVAAGIGFLTALSFIIANSVILYRGLNLECGCFGDLAVLQTRDALIIDVVLLIMAFQVLVHRGEFLSLDSLFFCKRSPGKQSG